MLKLASVPACKMKVGKLETEGEGIRFLVHWKDLRNGTGVCIRVLPHYHRMLVPLEVVSPGFEGNDFSLPNQMDGLNQYLLGSKSSPEPSFYFPEKWSYLLYA